MSKIHYGENNNNVTIIADLEVACLENSLDSPNLLDKKSQVDSVQNDNKLLLFFSAVIILLTLNFNFNYSVRIMAQDLILLNP